MLHIRPDVLVEIRPDVGLNIRPDLGLHPAGFVDVEIRQNVSLDILPDLWLHPVGYVSYIRPDVLSIPLSFRRLVSLPLQGIFFYLSPCNLLTSSHPSSS